MRTRMLTAWTAAVLPLTLVGGAAAAAPHADRGPAAHSAAAKRKAFQPAGRGSAVPPGQAKKKQSPAPSPTPTPTQEPTPSPTPEPTQEPPQEPPQEPTPSPTQEPTSPPVSEPTPEPTPAPSPTATPTVPVNVDLVLDWRDDFDGPAGSAPNPSIWNFELGGSGRGNGNLEYTTNRPENVSLDGAGNLVLTARSDNVKGLNCWYGPCRYTSGRITTQGKKTASHGRVEARMKLPKGKGLWPAFWLLGANYEQVGHPQSGEIDIMELVGDEPFRAWASVHGPGYTLAGHTGRHDLPDGATFNDDFHTFAVDWTADELIFSVDGHEFYRMLRSQIGDNEWVFDKEFFVILNLTVGGSWGGEPAPDTQFPAQMVIDHIAVYRPAS